MSNGRKPVPYPTCLWAKPPGGFITRRPCQRVGFAHEISKNSAPAYRGLLKSVNFFCSKYGEPPSEGTGCRNAAVAGRSFTGD